MNGVGCIAQYDYNPRERLQILYQIVLSSTVMVNELELENRDKL